jgi:hypothetical protein
MTRTVLVAVPGRLLPDLRTAASVRLGRISLLRGAPPTCTALSPCRHLESRLGLALSSLDDIYGRA